MSCVPKVTEVSILYRWQFTSDNHFNGKRDFLNGFDDLCSLIFELFHIIKPRLLRLNHKLLFLQYFTHV